MMNFELLVATNNAHKLKEIRKILSPFHITVYGINDLNLKAPEVEENGKTYYENALIKASSLMDLTTMPIIADDSGLEIKAMNDEPGIYSARFADKFGGHDKAIEYILKEVEGKTREAHFKCCIVMVNLGDKPLKFEADVPGEIAHEVYGEGGFGYDPIFVEASTGRTYASMSEEEKNLLSHRGKALKKLLVYLTLNGLAY